MTSKRFIYFILAVFIAGNLLMIFVQYNSSKNIENLTSGNEKLLYELRVNNELREMERDLLSVEKKIRGSVALNNVTYLDGIDDQLTEAKKFLDSFKQISTGDSTIQNINRLIAMADEKLALKTLLLTTYNRTGNLLSDSLKTIFERRMLSSEVNDLSRNVFNSRQQLLNELTASVSTSGRKARLWGNIMILLVLVSGALLFWYIINRIIRQNQLIVKLDASEKKLRELSMIKENFMANMSHEIRTPMNAILGFSNLIKTKNKDPQLNEYIDSIQKSGSNLITIINDILDLSKIEAGMLRIESIPFNLRFVVDTIQSLFQEKIHEKGLLYSVVIDETIPEILSGDATRLSQILVNMLGNAIKFTPSGSIKLTLTNKGQKDHFITIGFTISDTGIGIAKDKLTGIFDRFSQAEESTTRKYGGTGLGLSIVKELVLMQKGEIYADSEQGKGTTFNFSIPYKIAENQLIVPPINEQYNPGIQSPETIHILVAEDNEMNQNLMRHLLSGWNFSFEIAGNGIEALDLLKKTEFNLILMDIQMPGKDGYNTAIEARSLLKIDTPIIAMTAQAFPGEREKCLSYGMNEYLSKPINEKELLLLIMQFTGIKARQTFPVSKAPAKNNGDYQYLRLEYLWDISLGNTEYEKEVMEQFLEAIPSDIESLDSALASRDHSRLRSVAHNMKTNISVMGLTEYLAPYLDILENEDFDETRFGPIITKIKDYCAEAIKEARRFYSTF